jgi:hypothetical protein
MARSGGTDAAWAAFVGGGFSRLNHDAAAKTLEGRLLKDKAVATTGLERQGHYRAAAAAYARAAELGPSTYALINAGTLSLLAGEDGKARQLALAVLEALDAQPDEPETPYYYHATKAEALLLLNSPAAQEAFRDAVAVAARAWEDHASTLRQLALILNAQGKDASWLDEHRPPRSVHFGGHMSFHPHRVRADLKAEIDATLRTERIGFGFGALAAGTDILVAEALLEHGAELHAILPGGVESFASLSVDPYGHDWRRRFDVVLERAASLRIVRPLTNPDKTMIVLSDEIAMGAALMSARRLESTAVQLLVLAEGASERARDAWADGGRRQHVLFAPREEVAAKLPAAPLYPWRRLALLAALPERRAQLGAVREMLAAVQESAVGPYLEAGAVTLAYRTPLEAARVAIRLRQALPGLRIGGHYGVAETFQDPFSGGERIAGDAAAAAAGALSSALPGTAYITEDFAAALIAASDDAPRTEYIGELDPPDDGPPVGLFVLKS